MRTEFETLRIDRSPRLATVTIDHPPVNLLDASLFRDVHEAAEILKADPELRVVVVQSALPEFFVGHADLSLVDLLPRDEPILDELSPIQNLMDEWAQLPCATIAKIRGRVCGGGSEYALALDMRFGCRATTRVVQPEVAFGSPPGAGGTQRLSRLIGSGRALEVVLGCDAIPGSAAELYGYLNRALEPAELDPFVDRLATRIASFPRSTIELAKRSIRAASSTWKLGFNEEARCFHESFSEPEGPLRRGRFLEMGGQQLEAELCLEDWLPRLAIDGVTNGGTIE